MGATFYDAFLAIETKILIDQALRGEKGRKQENENLSWLKPRHIFFHFLVWSYGIATVIVLNAGDEIIGYTDCKFHQYFRKVIYQYDHYFFFLFLKRDFAFAGFNIKTLYLSHWLQCGSLN